jgi:hypothetical protein
MSYNYNCNNSTAASDNVRCIEGIDPWTCYLGKVISVMVNDKTQPIRGRLVRIDTNYLYLERLSGNITTILRGTVTRIITTRDKTEVI